jgi:hypothetical protein
MENININNSNKQNYILTKEQYQALKSDWSANKTHSAAEILAYNVLRGVDPHRGFTPITNKKKLVNGLSKDGAFERARHMLRMKSILSYKTKDNNESSVLLGVALTKENLDKILERV